MNTRHMHALVTAARCGSINRGALELGITAPALKHEIDAIEREVGLRIFRRSAGGLALTAPGEAVVETFRRSLAELDEGLLRARSMESGGTDLIRAFYVPFQFTEPAHVYSEAIARYRAEHPDVAISFQKIERERPIETTDILLGAVDTDATETVGHLLTTIPVYAAVSLDHPLASRKALVPSDLDGFRLIVPNRPTLAHVTPSLLPHLDSRAGGVVWRTDSMGIDDINSTCLTSETIALVIGRDPMVTRALVTVPLAGHAFNYRLYTRSDADPTVREYVDFIVEAYRPYREGHFGA